MFYVVHFAKENVVENVPSNWTQEIDGRTFCLWPKKLSSDKVSKLIKSKASPSQTWDLFACTIKYKCASYEESRVKCQEAAYLTFTEASSDESDHHSIDSNASTPKSLPPSPPKKKSKKSAKPAATASSSKKCTTASSRPNNVESQYENINEQLSTLNNKQDSISKMCVEGFSKLHKEILDCKEEIKMLKQSTQEKKVHLARTCFLNSP